MVAPRFQLNRSILLPSLLQVRFPPMTDLAVAASVPPHQLDCNHATKIFDNLPETAVSPHWREAIHRTCLSFLSYSVLIVYSFPKWRVLHLRVIARQHVRTRCFLFSEISDIFEPSTHTVHYPKKLIACRTNSSRMFETKMR
jgi:hypothetical protein